MKDRHNGYMPFPHTFTDQIMPLVGSSEWKVFHIVIRCTLGWCKVWDEISISQFVARTGMTRQCVSSALDTACKRGIIQANKTNRQRIKYALIYPDIEYAEELVKNLNEKTRQNILQELVKILDESYGELVKKIDQLDEKLVKKLDTQKIVLKDNVKEKEEEVDNTIQSNKRSKEVATLPPPSSTAKASELSESELDIIELINQLCATTWSPQRDIDADTLRELCEYPDDTAKWALKTSRERKPSIRPPGIVTYALGVIRRYNEENQGDIQEKQGDGVLAEGVKELQDAYYWLDIAINGHKHTEIAYGLNELSELTDSTIEELYAAHVPQPDDNYKPLAEYQQMYEEAQDE